MRLNWLRLALLALAAETVRAEADLPTELNDCAGTETSACFNEASALLDSGCGARFVDYWGRISWPVLKNVGPVVIAVQTRFILEEHTLFPLYVEVRNRTSPVDRLECDNTLGGQVVLVAQGADQCGGTWESVGPIDLRRWGVPLGAPYSVQCVFFHSRVAVRSVALACIRVTPAPTAVTTIHWAKVKALYQSP